MSARIICILNNSRAMSARIFIARPLQKIRFKIAFEYEFG